MDVSELTLAVQRLFGDTAEAQITGDDILLWLNAAQIEIAKNTEVLQKHAEKSLVAGEKCYSVPADALFIRRVEVNGKKVPRVDFEEIDTILPERNASPESEGDPAAYWVWNNFIYFWPTPGVSGVNNLDVWYIRRPATLSTPEDLPEIPVYMHEDMVRYAVMRAKELDEDWEASSLLRQDFEQRVAEDRHNFNNPNRDSYPSVRALPGDLGW